MPPVQPPIEPVPPGRRIEAISRLFAASGVDLDRAERFLEYSREHGIDTDRMWCRLSADGSIVGTVLAVPNPGKTAIVFASPVSSGAEIAEHGHLVATVASALATEPVALLQTLIDPGDHLLERALVSGGFTPLADLSYMERPRRGGAGIGESRWPEGTEIVPYPDSSDDEVRAILEASYEDTLDCPGLRGLRRTEDILAGHRASGAFEPELWTVIRLEGRLAGVMLLNPAPASNTVELVYIGLAAHARGIGLGRALLRHGLRLLEPRRERAMTLAVDDRNDPALRLYQSEGFRRVLRRRALIRSV
jgi:ribosomal protein S18 acetylase RimI-like enzyme